MMVVMNDVVDDDNVVAGDGGYITWNYWWCTHFQIPWSKFTRKLSKMRAFGTPLVLRTNYGRGYTVELGIPQVGLFYVFEF